MPANTVKVDRSTKWGNPWPIAQSGGCEAAIAKFKAWLYSLDIAEIYNYRYALQGKNLACWCPLDKPCHADVLLELANK